METFTVSVYTLSNFTVPRLLFSNNCVWFFSLIITLPSFPKLSVMAAQKVALVTAGTAGLGAQIARTLAPDFRVVCG